MTRSRTMRLLAPFLVIALARCSALGPFEGPQPTADTHSLCYNSRSTTPDQLKTLARSACNGSAPQFIAQHFDIAACPLLVPMRLTFTCTS
ncbi:MAG: hypothetical protein ACREFP_27115 [Acetobacteraceae bacterium]